MANVGFCLPEFNQPPPHPNHTYQPWAPPRGSPVAPVLGNKGTHILGLWTRDRKAERRNPQMGPGWKSNPWKLQSKRCQERFFTVAAAYHRDLSSFGDDIGRPDFFVTSHSALALIMQHTNRNFLSDHINHLTVTRGSIGTARTMWWELSTPSLKSTRCIIQPRVIIRRRIYWKLSIGMSIAELLASNTRWINGVFQL